MAPQSCTDFTGPAATDRATESSMRAVNSMKDFCHSAHHAFLSLQMRAKLSDTGSETYREMIAPSLSAEHFRYEQGINFHHHVHVSMCKILQEGMMVTGKNYAENDPDLPDIQPRPLAAETTPSQLRIPETTPTQPHPPPENTPPPPPPYLVKVMTASAEEMPSQKPLWSDPPGTVYIIIYSQLSHNILHQHSVWPKWGYHGDINDFLCNIYSQVHDNPQTLYDTLASVHIIDSTQITSRRRFRSGSVLGLLWGSMDLETNSSCGGSHFYNG